jgi:riboflavin kinase/FMN adenylyltransferase
MEQTKRVIALGFFDGVHRGHGALLRRVVERAAQEGAVPSAVTFDHHPKDLIPGAEKVPLLNTPADREELMHRLYGIREVMVLPFDAHMRDMYWRDFVTELLVKEYGAVHLVAGHDFHFGRRGEGDPARLQALCQELGLGCDIIGKVELDGVTVSSTYIRALIDAGDMERAGQFLGHPHSLSGPVVHGKQLGRTIGIPTSNLVIPQGVLVPAFGVYATKVWIDGKDYQAVTNVGVRPTVEHTDRVTVEPWILDFDGDLYGQTIRVEFFKHLRGEKKFASVDELKGEILRNADQTRAYFKK